MKHGGRLPKNSGQILPRVSPDNSKRAGTVAAEAAGMSRESYRKAKAVVGTATAGRRIEGGELAIGKRANADGG